jgi:hypothetical protein
LSITASPSVRDDVVARLAADQDPAHRPDIADAQHRIAAMNFRGSGVGEIGAMPLPGVNHQEAAGAGGLQQPSARRNRGAQQADVVAEALAEAPGLQKIPLHVDNEERGARGLDLDRKRLGIE